MADNRVPEHVDPSTVMHERTPSAFRLSYRGKWLLIAIVVSLLAWAMVIGWAVQLLSR